MQNITFFDSDDTQKNEQPTTDCSFVIEFKLFQLCIMNYAL